MNMKDISIVLLAWPEGKLNWSGPIDLKKSGFFVGGRLLLANALSRPITIISSRKAKEWEKKTIHLVRPVNLWQHTHEKIYRQLFRHKRMHEVKDCTSWQPNVPTTRYLEREMYAIYGR